MGKSKLSSVNPVEKARRLAKQKDAKKQKKQRVEARNSNLRGRNPNQIIMELERLDKIEYSLDDEGPKLNEKVIANKRKKMLDLWIRILNAYRKDDPSKFTELKRLQMEYEANKVRLVKNYEAINSAKKVDLEQIPLPSSGLDDDTAASTATTEIDINKLKTQKFLMINGETRTDLKIPGCPALIPPSLKELEEELKISASTSADLDEFLKEVDQVEKMASSKETVADKLTAGNKEINFAKLPPPLIPKPPIGSLPNTTVNSAPFPVLLNPMGLLNPHSIKKPPGLMPPGSMLRPPIPPNKYPLPNKNQQPIKREPTGPIIESKPQLRNLSADLTKFLPTSLRIKRNQPEAPKRTFNKPFSQVGFQPRQTVSSTTSNASTTTQANKDTAYEDFMKEISGLTD